MKFGRVLLIVPGFVLLAVAAATGFPHADGDGELPRGLRMLDFFAHTLVTDHLGPAGGTSLFIVLGFICAVLIWNKADDNGGTIKTNIARKLQPAPDIGIAAARRSETRKNTPPQKEIEERPDFEDLFTIFSGDTRTSPVAAWGLMLASPFKGKKAYSSWFGGLPCAYQGFEWPRDSDDGLPMHFFAQIDLNDLNPEPETNSLPPGLPQKGAMLIFIRHGCSISVVSEDEMQDAVPIHPPSDIPHLRDRGYFSEGTIFPAWPIEPCAFLDHPFSDDTHSEDIEGHGRPASFPLIHTEPTDWITNWGMAVLDAELALYALGHDLRRARNSKGPIRHPETQAYYDLLLKEGQAVFDSICRWKERAENKDPATAVDSKALESIFEVRRDFCSKVEAQFSGTVALNGSPQKVWGKIFMQHRNEAPFESFKKIAEPYRQFANERIIDWRRHRLFGLEPPFMNNLDDLRGKACIFSIGADPLLGTQTEHHYGLSVWGTVEDVNSGRLNQLEVIHHSAV